MTGSGSKSKTEFPLQQRGMQMRATRGQRRREWREMERALALPRRLIANGVDAAISYARTAPDELGTPPPTFEVVVALREAIALTATASGLSRAACIEVVRNEFEIQLCEKTLSELNAESVGQLILYARKVLATALVQIQ